MTTAREALERAIPVLELCSALLKGASFRATAEDALMASENARAALASEGPSRGPVADLAELNRLYAEIPDGPYLVIKSTGGHEIRQIDTDPTNKHHWPYRLCQSIVGQKANCDDAVFDFICGVLNAWPHITATPSSAPGLVEAAELLERVLSEDDTSELGEEISQAFNDCVGYGGTGNSMNECFRRAMKPYINAIRALAAPSPAPARNPAPDAAAGAPVGSVVMSLTPAPAPGHTDLMVSPESIDAFMDANPLPAPPPDRLDDVARECAEQIADGCVDGAGKLFPELMPPIIAAALRRAAASYDKLYANLQEERERHREARAQIEELTRERDEARAELETMTYLALVDPGALHVVSWKERAEAAERDRDALRERLAEAETALREAVNGDYDIAYFTKHGA